MYTNMLKNNNFCASAKHFYNFIHILKYGIPSGDFVPGRYGVPEPF